MILCSSELPIILHLLDFAPLIQLAAGFYIVFIVIDYSKSFTYIIAKHVFNFKGQLSEKLSELKYNANASLERYETNEHFKEGKGKKSFESTKLSIDSFNKDIDDKIKSESISIDNTCRCDLFRYLSIYMFLFCICALFVSGMRRHEYEWLQMMMALTSISFIISISLILASYKIYNTQKFDRCCLCLIIIMNIAAIVVALVFKNRNLDINLDTKKVLLDWTVISTVVLPYLDFWGFMVIIFVKSRKIEKNCRNLVQSFSKRKKEIDKELNDMQGYLNQEEREKQFEIVDDDAE